MKERFAAIDFGTNTARLLIVDRFADGSFEHIHLQREIVRMGGGFTREHGLSAEAIQRGRSCLQRFSEAIASHAVSRVAAVATSAVRDAVNGGMFVDAIRSETGIELSVIDGVCEGNLTLAGVISGLDREYDELLVVDVGGGSTEYTLARSGQPDFVRSLPLGVVRLTEGKVSVEAMEDKINRELEMLRSEMLRAGQLPGPGVLMVGTAGTATTLAAIDMEMVDYDYRLVNNYLIPGDNIKRIFDRLLPMSLEERLAVPGLEKGREDLVVSGMLVILQSMRLFGMDTMKVSDYGLLEGLVVAGGVSMP